MWVQPLVEPGIANVNYTMFEADRKQPAAVEKQAVNEHSEPEGERPPHGEDDDESDLDLSFGA